MSENQLAVVESAHAIVRPQRGVKLETLDDYFRFADIALASGLAPKAMTSADAVVVALIAGSELGLPAMQSLQNIGVINGKPAPYGDAVPGIVLSSGLCVAFEEWLEEEGEVVDSLPDGKLSDWPDSFTWVTSVQRKGRSKPRVSRFSVGDAKRANLWGKGGPWSQFPQRMLRFKSMGFAMRDEFPDVLRGFVPYEDLADYSEEKPIAMQTEVAEVVVAIDQDDDDHYDDEPCYKIFSDAHKLAEIDTMTLRNRRKWIKDNEPNNPHLRDVVIELRKRAAADEKAAAEAQGAAEREKPKKTFGDAVRERTATTEKDTAEAEEIFGTSEEYAATEGVVIEEDQPELVMPRTKKEYRDAFTKAVAKAGFDVSDDNFGNFILMLNGCLAKINVEPVAELSEVPSGKLWALTQEIHNGTLVPADMMHYPALTEA